MVYYDLLNFTKFNKVNVKSIRKAKPCNIATTGFTKLTTCLPQHLVNYTSNYQLDSIVANPCNTF